MKKFCLLALCGIIMVAAGCSEETKDSAAEAYTSVVDLGKYLLNDFDESVNKYKDKDPNDHSHIEEPEYDVLADTIKNLSKSYTANGEQVLGILSGAKASDLTVLIQMGNESHATVVGKLITSDGCEYVEGLNDLEAVDGVYLYDFCGINGVIRKTIGNMANRKFEVYQYDAYSTNISAYEDLDYNYVFDVLTLYDNGEVCGFYFNERVTNSNE